MAYQKVNTKETLKFTKDYKHGITGDTAQVDAEVTIDYKRGTFFIDQGSMHLPEGFGRGIQLPKMIATCELLVEICEFVEAELQGFSYNA